MSWGSQNRSSRPGPGPSGGYKLGPGAAVVSGGLKASGPLVGGAVPLPI